MHEVTSQAKLFPTHAAPGSNSSTIEQQQQQSSSGRRFCYSNVGVRVWWFDQQLLTAIHGTPTADDPTARQPIRQVVILGAGFDTRPWRLKLPSGVHWYEVDLPDVVAAKRRQLAQLGASFASACANGATPAPPAAAGGAAGAAVAEAATGAGAGAAMGGVAGGAAGAAAGAGATAVETHPLKAASWTALSANLGRPRWSEALRERGLDPAQPVVWVAEGLLMYLTPGEAAALLQEMAGGWPGRAGCHG